MVGLSPSVLASPAPSRTRRIGFFLSRAARGRPFVPSTRPFSPFCREVEAPPSFPIFQGAFFLLSFFAFFPYFESNFGSPPAKRRVLLSAVSLLLFEDSVFRSAKEPAYPSDQISFRPIEKESVYASLFSHILCARRFTVTVFFSAAKCIAFESSPFLFWRFL